jgi:predicted nucleic acid-binding protein
MTSPAVRPAALLDANVLVQAPLRDTLLRAAEADLFAPLWSPAVLAELAHTLRRLRAADPEALAKVARLLRALVGSFPDALVDAADLLRADLTSDPGDRHVVVAALAGKADVLVTHNVRDFPAALEEMGQVVRVVSPDAFLLDLLARDRARIEGILDAQGAALHPPRTRAAVLASLAPLVPGFVAALA